MIAERQMTGALLALNAVLVHTRTLVFEGVTNDKIAQMLDIAELLPMLMVRAGDATAEFRAHLEDLARLDIGFNLALQRFDKES